MTITEGYLNHPVFKLVSDTAKVFFFDHLGDKLLLRLQLWESVTHLCHKCRHELMQETVFLSEESISIANGSSQDTTDDVTCLCI